MFLHFLIQQTKEQLLLQNWWVIITIALTYIVFSLAIQTKDIEIEDLVARKEYLLEEKLAVLKQHEELSLQVKSMDDPEYIKLILMKRLGVVPSHQTKVVFQTE